MNKFARMLAGAALVAATGLATAATTVDAKNNSLVGGSAASTGVFLTDGESFSVVVSTSQIWDNAFDNPLYASDADGHAFQTAEIDGLLDSIGSLVGEIGDGPLFHVGTSFSGVAAGAGELKLFYFDEDAYNNTGFVDASVSTGKEHVTSAVPEPANAALVALALGMFALQRRRKS
jgi:hypothetical protein